jgi:hypothetical protein
MRFSRVALGANAKVWLSCPIFSSEVICFSSLFARISTALSLGRTDVCPAEAEGFKKSASTTLRARSFKHLEAATRIAGID